MSRQITDTLKRPDGSAYANVTVRFVADQTSADDGSVVQHSDSTTTTDESGALSIELQNGVYLVYVDGARSLYLGKATITDGDPATLAEVLGASESVTSAVLAAVEAAVAPMAFDRQAQSAGAFEVLSDDDILLGVDVSDTTGGAEGTTKGLTIGQIKEAVLPDAGVTTNKLRNGAVTFEKLANTSSFGGILSSGSANTIAKTGIYLVTAQLDDMPSGASASGYLDVRNYSGGSWVVQTFTALLEPDAIWQRVIRIGRQVFYPWVSLKAPTGGLPFAGKHMVFFGDSITENGDYPARVASRLGCTVTNLGIGGTQMAEHNALAWRPFSMCKLAGTIASGDYETLQDDADFLLSDKGKDVSAQVTAMSQIDWNAVDYIVMGYGTNDYGNGMPIGAASDTTGATFCGAVNVTVDTILTAYPHIRLFFVSPMYRDRIASGDGLNSDDNPNSNGDYLVEFVDALKERCAAHHVPCLDMYRTSMVGKHTASTYLVDGLHPRSGIGYQLVADKVSAALAGSY